jgi:hypothetical protein
MYEEYNDYLKRRIKRTYKRYIKERTDETATISDVAKFFNISIDPQREEDYKVESIDYNIPSIVISDTKKNVLFHSQLTNDAKLLEYSSTNMAFIEVKTIYESATKESLYFIGKNTPIIEKLTIEKDEYKLEFEKETSNQIRSFRSEFYNSFIIRLLEKVSYKAENYEDRLLTREFGNLHSTEKLEHYFTFKTNNVVRTGNNQEKSFYFLNDNLIYRINLCDYGPTEEHQWIKGICFEKDVEEMWNYLPIGFNEYNETKKNSANVISGMIFSGFTNDRKHYFIIINKEKECFKISLNSCIYSEIENQEDKKENNCFDIPCLVDGTITREEISYLVTQLNGKIDNKILAAIGIELFDFGNKLAQKRKKIKEEIDPLHPKLFADKSFEKVTEDVLSNFKAYFNIALTQFEALSSASKTQGDFQRALKRNNQFISTK